MRWNQIQVTQRDGALGRSKQRQASTEEATWYEDVQLLYPPLPPPIAFPLTLTLSLAFPVGTSTSKPRRLFIVCLNLEV